MKNIREDVFDEFDGLNDKDAAYTVGDSKYMVADMVAYIKENKVPREKIHIKSITYMTRWDDLNCLDLATHIQRVKRANLKYPIIIHWDGKVVDGYHRITKAILEKRERLRAYRIDVLLLPNK